MAILKVASNFSLVFSLIASQTYVIRLSNLCHRMSPFCLFLATSTFMNFRQTQVRKFSLLMLLCFSVLRLCDEHCNIHGNNGILDAEPLEYPGNDNKCVGFCPCKSLYIFLKYLNKLLLYLVDCKWEPTIEENCETFKQNFFNNPG